jgi:hypothetical protein
MVTSGKTKKLIEVQYYQLDYKLNLDLTRVYPHLLVLKNTIGTAYGKQVGLARTFISYNSP